MGKKIRRQIPDRLKSESGQSIVLISVVIMSFMMFFMFALNTGLLINAKISVQAAADAAAYAGAATQGRQLNAVSFLNYDMRRQFKKLVFRYNFVGSMGSPQFPTNSAANTSSPDYDFPKLDYPTTGSTGSGTLLGMNVPVVCIPITSAGTANDNCMFINQPDTVSTLPSNSLNPVLQALKDQLTNIQATQSKICEAQGSINLFTLIAWLFRGETTSSSLTALLATLQSSTTNPATQADMQHAVDTMSALVQGLGLYPRNIIDLMRIQTLIGFLNEKHVEEIDSDLIQSWEKAGTAEAKERSIQAFHSAEANLNADIFDSSKLQMVELQGDNLINIEPVLINFNAYVQQMKKNPLDPSTPASPSFGHICESQIDPFPVIGAPIGVKLVGDARVNYAVRIKAFIKPRGLLFLPGSDSLELDAMAGAKPFGSRIGPRLIGQDNLAKKIAPSPVNGTAFDCASTQQDCYVPWYQIGAAKNTFTIAYLNELRTKAMAGGTSFNFAGIQLAQQLAVAPNPQEVGHYNILPSPKSSTEMPFEFIPYSTSKDPGIYRFYGPIFPQGNGDPAGKVDQFLDRIFPTVAVGPTGSLGIPMAIMKKTVGDSIKSYISSNLASGQGTENGETETFAAIELPLANKDGSTLSPSTDNTWLTTPKQVLSSWAPDSVRNSDDYGFAPRFGYSIKFVTLRDLKLQGLSSDDDDLDKIEH